MNRLAPSRPALHMPALDRVEAAHLLRRARSARFEESCELIDWVHSALPASRPVQRLKIDTLLAQGDTHGADALIAQGLLARPTDLHLSFRSARSLFLQERFEEADRTIRLVLPRRTKHLETLVLAGRIAQAHSDHDRAVNLLQPAHRRRPDRLDITGWLIDSMLALGNIEPAAALLETCDTPPATMQARVLAAQGRQLQAISLLDARLIREDDPTLRDELLAMLIDLLDEGSDHPRLDRLTRRLSPDTPRALIRSARALLARGRFTLAVEQLDALDPVRRASPQALAIALVAKAVTGRTRAADAELLNLEPGQGPTNRRFLADCWQRALLGRFLSDRRTGEEATGQADACLLQSLTRKSLGTLDRARNRLPAADPRSAEIDRHRSACLVLLGRPHQAVAVEAARVG